MKYARFVKSQIMSILYLHTCTKEYYLPIHIKTSNYDLKEINDNALSRILTPLPDTMFS